MNIITYGTFDTFHYGHLELLLRAKALGNFLVVGLSTDHFNFLKGKKTIFSFEKRKEWLSSIKFIDLIIEENSWEQKIADIQKYSIDILVMGDDWQGKFDYLPCSCIYLPRTQEISSTEIKKILSKQTYS
jgi:glycerol-3-phosphate cytidylyltransferase